MTLLLMPAVSLARHGYWDYERANDRQHAGRDEGIFTVAHSARARAI